MAANGVPHSLMSAILGVLPQDGVSTPHLTSVSTYQLQEWWGRDRVGAQPGREKRIRELGRQWEGVDPVATARSGFCSLFFTPPCPFLLFGLAPATEVMQVQGDPTAEQEAYGRARRENSSHHAPPEHSALIFDMAT